jgi:amidohydrolase
MLVRAVARSCADTSFAVSVRSYSVPVVPQAAMMHRQVTLWRRDLHRNPEILFAVHRTARLVVEKLKSFGCDEVVSNVGKTGVVAVIGGAKSESNKVIGMRADMDALTMTEATGLPYASTVRGRMHACGHDGHTAMLLGAAKHLCETRNFDGKVVVIFQPAEEGGAGGKAMVDDGLMERWNIQEVYGMHNMPGLPAGQFATRPGALLAANDTVRIRITGNGGHASRPHECTDSVFIAAQVVSALHSIVSRNLDPLEAGVISICMMRAGEAENVIPQVAELRGTARSLTPEVRDLIESRIIEVAAATARMHGAQAKVTYRRAYPVTRNHARQTAFATDVARQVAGAENVDPNIAPVMGGEDFSFMLQARPGAFIFIGNGDSAGVHHPKYDFNDGAIPAGISFWARLAESAMPV